MKLYRCVEQKSLGNGSFGLGDNMSSFWGGSPRVFHMRVRTGFSIYKETSLLLFFLMCGNLNCFVVKDAQKCAPIRCQAFSCELLGRVSLDFRLSLHCRSLYCSFSSILWSLLVGCSLLHHLLFQCDCVILSTVIWSHEIFLPKILNFFYQDFPTYTLKEVNRGQIWKNKGS